MALPSFVKKILLLPILLVVIFTLNALIEPQKTLTDIPRNDMNCPNTPDFNKTLWDSQTASEHEIYATGCYSINWGVIVFLGGLTALAIWGWWNK